MGEGKLKSRKQELFIYMVESTRKWTKISTDRSRNRVRRTCKESKI